MQNTFLAPLLSATSSTEVIWIMALASLLDLGFGVRAPVRLDLGRARDRVEQAPALGLRHRARLDDLDEVAHLRGVVLVVHVILHAASQELVEPAVADAPDHGDRRRLVHGARGHRADDDAARAAPVLRYGHWTTGERCAVARIGHDFAFWTFFWPCVSLPRPRARRIVRIRAISRRLCTRAAVDVTWLVCWPSWSRNSSSRVRARVWRSSVSGRSRSCSRWTATLLIAPTPGRSAGS